MEFRRDYPAAVSEVVMINAAALDAGAVLSDVNMWAEEDPYIYFTPDDHFVLSGLHWQLHATVTNRGHSTEYILYMDPV